MIVGHSHLTVFGLSWPEPERGVDHGDIAIGAVFGRSQSRDAEEHTSAVLAVQTIAARMSMRTMLGESSASVAM